MIILILNMEAILLGGEIGQAHAWCQSTVLKKLFSGETVCACNTNTTLPELNAYVCAAIFGELSHKIVFAVMPEKNPEVLAKRGLHGVTTSKENNNKKGPFQINTPNAHPKFMYTGIFLNQQSIESLRFKFVQWSRQCLLPRLAKGHMTLKYKPSLDDVSALGSGGNQVSLKIIGYAFHSLVQCALVDIIDESYRGMCANKFPHITISHDENCPPYNSNELLKYGRVCLLPENECIFVTGNVGAVPFNSNQETFTLGE
ncbi:hypothetical protein RFI_13542 [Reticulomyxa filosa]|uniref:tRNA ligase phosphodiesterase domain-containing protein n=1 Tax=Reticulomyxa filosa TaxID=46433 RepID=X6NC79_RETFI|nr:hypothetical protein RFI_13542 [Reticulomyxa filosa]|eukprot:ETO23636.1 hypothetical protein RFI_13542 [Reticulomyxa filosa]